MAIFRICSVLAQNVFCIMAKINHIYSRFIHAHCFSNVLECLKTMQILNNKKTFMCVKPQTDSFTITFNN